MIERLQQKAASWERRWWQAAFALLLVAVLVCEAAPQLTANAIYILTDGVATATTGAERVDSSRIIFTGAENGETDMMLEAGEKVTIWQDGGVQYATGRAGETVSALLQREGISVGPQDMVRVILADGAVYLDIASDFTYYETVAEDASYTTVFTEDYTIPKGETRITQQGQEGQRDVTYKVVYDDGAMISREAVIEGDSSAVDQIASVGTMVTEAQSGDTIAEVVRNDDGSGYLLMNSGDSLHFTDSMNVKCTAYTTGEPGVGTITYTGTTVHVGVVAVDKSVISLGSKMFITTTDGSYTYGMASAEDTGVYGHNVDLYMNNLDECEQFGRRSSVVYFLDQ